MDLIFGKGASSLKEPGEKSSAKTYRLIIDYLRQGIEGGRFHRGQKLPSEKELCEHFSTSRSSVREALSALEYIGLIEVRGGSGYYVSGSSLPLSSGEAAEHCATKIVFVSGRGLEYTHACRRLFEMDGLDGASSLCQICADEGAQWSRTGAGRFGKPPMIRACCQFNDSEI